MRRKGSKKPHVLLPTLTFAFRWSHLAQVHGIKNIQFFKAGYEELAAGNVPNVAASDIVLLYHGLPLDLYTFRPEPGDYLAFIGRISPEKRVDRAIEIASFACRCVSAAALYRPMIRNVRCLCQSRFWHSV